MNVMCIFPPVSALSLAIWMLPDCAFATVVGITPVEQPVNLGTRSNPAKIPLGRVAVINNHNYGIHQMIGEARPCPDGAMRWEGGSELDQNLASVFGISVETEDPTQITKFPVILRMKPWKPPGYSPYTKEQVLAATLWCLLRSAGGTPEAPLDVRVVAEGADDKPLEEKYSAKYVTLPGRDGIGVPPTEVPGTVIEEDERGIAWVAFPGVTWQGPPMPNPPGMIITKVEGDGDPGWYLLPVWGNGNDANDLFRLNFWSAIMCYSSYCSRGVREANSFLAEGGVNDFSIHREDGADLVSIHYPRVNQTTLAANILALVVSAQPTEARILTVSFMVEESALADYPAFRGAAGWKETKQNGPHNRSTVLECDFIWDAAAGKLAAGSVPLVEVDAAARFITEMPEFAPSPDAEGDAEKLQSQ
jgi:hypothetical protein